MVFDTQEQQDDKILTNIIRDLYISNKFFEMNNFELLNISVENGVCHVRNARSTLSCAELYRLSPLKDMLASVDIDDLHLPQDCVEKLGMLPIKANQTIIAQGGIMCSPDFIYRYKNLVLNTNLLDVHATVFHNKFIDCDIKCDTLRFYKCKVPTFENCNLEVRRIECILVLFFKKPLEWRARIINSFRASDNFIHILDCVFPIDTEEISLQFYASNHLGEPEELLKMYTITNTMPERYIYDFVVGTKHWYLYDI